MSENAIISTLWRGSSALLCAFVRQNPNTVVLCPEYIVSPDVHGMSDEIAKAGGRLEVLESLLGTEERRMIEAGFERSSGALQRFIASSEWERLSEAVNLPNSKLLGEAFSSVARGYLPPLMRAVMALKRASERYSIRLLVVNEDLTPIPRVATLWAKHNDIPSLMLSHGIYLGGLFTLHDTVHVDHLEVISPRGLEAYRDIGVDSARMTMGGNPKWDDYVNLIKNRAAVRQKLAQNYQVDPQKKLVMFATTWSTNNTTLEDEDSYGKTIRSMLLAYKALRDSQCDFQLVIKDRPQNQTLGLKYIQAMADELGLPPKSFVFAMDDPKPWVVGADVVISVDSNISIEAMISETPAISMVSRVGKSMGPLFSSDSGVIELEPEALPETLRRLLTDPLFAAQQQKMMRASTPYYAGPCDGEAGKRFIALMERLARPAKAKTYLWETHLNLENVGVRESWSREALFGFFKHSPRRVLDIGCHTGKTGEALKLAYPDAHVIGIEVSREAAKIAKANLDQVIEARFEEIDFEAVGIEPHSLDTVIVADVLEHMYNPWGVLVQLKGYLTEDAQVIASIPNIQNLNVMDELSKGRWRYDSWGLLDITHIRFFTVQEVYRLFEETGYRIESFSYNVDHRLADIFNRYQGQALCNIDLDRITLKNVTPHELVALCALQFFFRAEVGAPKPQSLMAPSDTPEPYIEWQKDRVLTPEEAGLWDQYLASWPTQPLIHVAVLIYGEGLSRVTQTLKSLAAQLYSSLRVTIVAETPPAEGFVASAQMSWKEAKGNLVGGASRALMETPSAWVGMVDAGCTFDQHSLLFFVAYAHQHPEWRVIYSDEDTLTNEGLRHSPHFKPDFNRDLLYASPYIGGFMLVAYETFLECSGFSVAYSGLEEYEFVLRASETLSDAAIGHIPEVLFHRRAGTVHVDLPIQKLHALGRRALEAHFSRLAMPMEVGDGVLPLSWQVRYHAREKEGVSIILICRDHIDALEKTIHALLEYTQHWPIELLLLDAASQTSETLAFFEALEAIGDPRIQIFRIPVLASWAAYANLIAQEAAHAYLLFLDFDTRPVDAAWLMQLISHAMRPDIGAVGARILDPTGTVLSTGRVLGVGGGIQTAFSGITFDDPGYARRALVDQNVSGLGPECLLTRASVFQALGGFDVGLSREAASVDYCQRVLEMSLRLFWSPHVSLVSTGECRALDWDHRTDGDHADSVEEIKNNAENDAANHATNNTEAWLIRSLARFARDPHYNPNLSRESQAVFKVSPRKTFNWNPLPWKPLPRVLVHPADNMGCGQYRILGPMRALTAAARVDGKVEALHADVFDMAYLDIDAIVYQRQITDEQIEALSRRRKISPIFSVYELDDLLLQLPGKSAHREKMAKDIASRLMRSIPLCDRFIVSTEPLKIEYSKFHSNIHVVPNMIEGARWAHLTPARRQSRRPRVGWVGGISHRGDLDMIVDVVSALADEVDWVFMGMCPESCRQYVKEFHGGVSFDLYPEHVARLNLDIAIAPLEVNRFNESKSNLKLLEYGILGYPVICSDVYPYQDPAFPVTRVKNRTNDWIHAIREHCADLDAAARMGDALKAHVKAHWMLEDHLALWLQAWLPSGGIHG